jgi:hypothetical protein
MKDREGALQGELEERGNELGLLRERLTGLQERFNGLRLENLRLEQKAGTCAITFIAQPIPPPFVPCPHVNAPVMGSGCDVPIVCALLSTCIPASSPLLIMCVSTCVCVLICCTGCRACE